MDLPKINFHYLTCIGHSVGMLLGKHASLDLVLFCKHFFAILQADFFVRQSTTHLLKSKVVPSQLLNLSEM